MLKQIMKTNSSNKLDMKKKKRRVVGYPSGYDFEN